MQFLPGTRQKFLARFFFSPLPDFLHDLSHQSPPHPPPPTPVLSPPLSGISICKMDLGTVVLYRTDPPASVEVVGPEPGPDLARHRQGRH